ncbi:MAG: cell division protein FtsZ [Methylophilaceae bacterium]|nr:cell division protein FtsZ [Methylophilaceae bacterium]
MTDLQFLLLAMGAVIIVAVLLFNWWQERKFIEASHRQFGDPQGDALMGDFQIDTEAVLNDKPLPQKAAYSAKTVAELKLKDEALVLSNATDESDHVAESYSMDKGNHDEAVNSGIVVDWAEGEDPTKTELNAELPSVAEVEYKTTKARSMELAPPLPETFFPQIDLTAVISLAQATSGIHLQQVFAELPDHNKLVRVYALNRDYHWIAITNGQHFANEQHTAEFSCIACGLQLADRAGPVIKDTLDRFQQAVNEAGAELNARVEWQSDVNIMQYANELDAFCIEVDKTVGFHVIQGGNGPFTGTKLRGLAEAGGLRLAEDGAFHYENEDGQKLFSVTNQDNYPFTSEMLRTSVIYRITFQLDVARVKNSIEAFNHMVLIARQMVSSLNALLVDDNQRSLSDAQLDKIRQQLKVIQLKMTGQGILPGSACALRLFS